MVGWKRRHNSKAPMKAEVFLVDRTDRVGCYLDRKALSTTMLSCISWCTPCEEKSTVATMLRSLVGFHKYRQLYDLMMCLA